MATEDVILQRVNREKPRTPDNVIYLSTIYNYLRQGLTTKNIVQANPAIRPETVTLARAFLIATDPDAYEAIRKNTYTGDKYKILIDENLPPKIVTALYPKYGRITHTNHVGLKGKKDPVVWEWAVNNNMDAILTRDKANRNNNDLTWIAVDNYKAILEAQFDRGTHTVSLGELPLIVHVNAHKGKVHKESVRILTHHALSIHEHIENRQSPYIQVSRSSIEIGPSLKDIRLDLSVEENPHMFMSRKDSWVKKWTKMIFAKADPTLSDWDRDRIREMVEESASICTTPEKNIKQYRTKPSSQAQQHSELSLD